MKVIACRERVGLFPARVGLVGAILVSGCSNMSTVPDDSSLRSLIQPVEVRLSIPQRDLYVQYERSGLSYAAAIGSCFTLVTCYAGAVASAYVDAPAIKEANARAVPLQDAIADVKVGGQFRDAYVADLAANDVRNEVILSTAAANDKDKLDAFSRSSAGSVMYATVKYFLTPDFSKIVVHLHTEVYAVNEIAREKFGRRQEFGKDPKRGTALSPLDAFYRSEIRYEATLPSPDETTERNAQAWGRDGGTRVRAAVLAGIEQTVHAASRDFGTRLWSAEAQLPQVKTRDGNGAGLVEDVPGQGRLLRLGNGNLLFEATVSEFPSTPVSRPIATP